MEVYHATTTDEKSIGVSNLSESEFQNSLMIFEDIYPNATFHMRTVEYPIGIMSVGDGIVLDKSKMEPVTGTYRTVGGTDKVVEIGMGLWDEYSKGDSFEMHREIPARTAQLTDETEIEKWLDDNKVLYYTIDNGVVNVNGRVDLHHKRLTSIPVQFGKVTESFDCSENELKSLAGCPHKVGEWFDCSRNKLKNLVGGPQSVEAYYCTRNELTDLTGIAYNIGHDIYCGNNPLESLDGLPPYSIDKVYGAPKELIEEFNMKNIPGYEQPSFGFNEEFRWSKKAQFLTDEAEIEKWLDDNRVVHYTIDNGVVNVNGRVDLHSRHLTSIPNGRVDLHHKRLTSIPVQFGKVTESFDCSENELKSLAGCPHKVGEWFDCSRNKLKNLVGGPQSVEAYYCTRNELTDLTGIAYNIGHDIYCGNNPLESLDGLPPYSIDKVYGAPKELIEEFNMKNIPGYEQPSFGITEEYRWSSRTAQLTDESEIEEWLENNGINHYVLHDNGVVDVDGDVDLGYQHFTTIPVQFGLVAGYFDCAHNQLESLAGCPRFVKEVFNCSNNNLLSLVGGPKSVGSYYCLSNKLTDLTGIAKEIKRNIYCGNNPLQSLDGLPPANIDKVVGAPAELVDNYEVTSNPTYEQPSFGITEEFRWSKKAMLTDETEIKKWLDNEEIKNYTIHDNGVVDVAGSVEIYKDLYTNLPVQFGNVTGTFQCEQNSLVSLAGCPHTVGKNFSCSENQLRDLVGGPKKVGWHYHCHTNKLKNLKGIAQDIGEHIDCSFNPLISLEGLNPSHIEKLDDIDENLIDDFRMKNDPTYEQPSFGITEEFRWSKKAQFLTDEAEIEKFLEANAIDEYLIEDGVVNVFEDVDIIDSSTAGLPVQFGKIEGDFDCSVTGLRSLEGCPHTVTGFFNCSNNRLDTLVGCPQTVEKHLDCSNNVLESLKGSPRIVGDWFDCNGNKLVDLVGGPQQVHGYSCIQNRLTDLTGIAIIITSRIWCSNNPLESLNGLDPLNVDKIRLNTQEIRNLVKEYNKIGDPTYVQPSFGITDEFRWSKKAMLTDEVEIKAWLDRMWIENYTIHDGVVDVNGSVDLYGKGLDSIPIQFGHVRGDFDCSENELKSLEGSPHTVDRNFNCYDNELTNLVGITQDIGGRLYCWDNPMESLEGMNPAHIDKFVDTDNILIEDFRRDNDPTYEQPSFGITDEFRWSKKAMLTDEVEIKVWLDDMGIQNYTINNGIVDVNGDVDLEAKDIGAIPIQFGHVKGSFYCGANSLTSLAGSPHTVDALFSCSSNKLDSLVGGPQKVGSYVCRSNNLKNLIGIAQDIANNIWCANNPLESLDGLNPADIDKGAFISGDLKDDFRMKEDPNYEQPSLGFTDEFRWSSKNNIKDIKMKHTRPFNVQEIRGKRIARFLIDEDEIAAWLDDMEIFNYTINDGIVDVEGYVMIDSEDLTTIPVQFGTVTSAFDCSDNDLVSLKGCPHTVGKYFDCSDNKLPNFVGGPNKVRNYHCCDNYNVDLTGIAQDIDNDIRCDGDYIESLDGLNPAHIEQVNADTAKMQKLIDEFNSDEKHFVEQPSFGVEDEFRWSKKAMLTDEVEIKKWLDDMGVKNYTINNGVVNVVGDVDLDRKNLEVIPVQFGKVTGFFNCSDNALASLIGAPRIVGDEFLAYNNQLTSLEGGPSKVGRSFNCQYNDLANLNGIAQTIGEFIYCYDNPLKSLDGLNPDHIDRVHDDFGRLIKNLKDDFRMKDDPTYEQPSFGITEEFRWSRKNSTLLLSSRSK